MRVRFEEFLPEWVIRGMQDLHYPGHINLSIFGERVIAVNENGKERNCHKTRIFATPDRSPLRNCRGGRFCANRNNRLNALSLTHEREQLHSHRWNSSSGRAFG